MVVALGFQVEVKSVDEVRRNLFQRHVFFLIPELYVVFKVIEGGIELIYRGLGISIADKGTALVVVFLIYPHYGFDTQKRFGIPSIILVPNCIERYHLSFVFQVAANVVNASTNRLDIVIQLPSGMVLCLGALFGLVPERNGNTSFYKKYLLPVRIRKCVLLWALPRFLAVYAF